MDQPYVEISYDAPFIQTIPDDALARMIARRTERLSSARNETPRDDGKVASLFYHLMRAETEQARRAAARHVR